MMKPFFYTFEESKAEPKSCIKTSIAAHLNVIVLLLHGLDNGCKVAFMALAQHWSERHKDLDGRVLHQSTSTWTSI